ncbi:molybdopterin synthase catalytic subunit-like [Dysidea avara]|uniref:molybdopterin synthase catalytic subunit-like n=1 Tax=Dysidea avara TaxID=196820 RepID=UPI0033317F3A
MTTNDIVRLTTDVLSVEEATSLVSDTSIGATSIFIGTTRDNFEGKKVLQLEYEAYEPQTLSEMKKICAAIRDKWVIHGIAMLHRTGNVPVGEASVIIAISSKHRKESLEAVEFAINTLKATVPIWKKEVYEDGKTEWKQNKECFWMANTQS